MYTLLLGCIVLGATALAFWLALPVGGKVRRWITPRLEPLVAVAIVGGAGVGTILVVLGVASAFG
jgi:hypothetical protein